MADSLTAGGADLRSDLFGETTPSPCLQMQPTPTPTAEHTHGRLPNLTVAINTLSIDERNEGTKTMLVHLVPALLDAAPELHLVALAHRGNRHLVDPRCEVVEVAGGGGSAALRILADQVTVPRWAKRSADVLVCLSGVPPLRRSGPEVAVVAAHLALPSCRIAAGEDGMSAWRRVYYGAPFRWALRRCSVVSGISEFLTEGVVRELGVDRGRTVAMPLGSAPPAAVGGAPADPPVVLFVGTLYAYKDADVLVRAFAEAAPHLAEGTRLVIAGKDVSGQHVRLEELARRSGVVDRVHLLGMVDDETLEDLYATASVFVLPSRCEGYGLPVAEAMHRGLPVVVAAATSLPEVVGSAGICVEPGDVAGFAAALRHLLTDESEHQRRRQASLERAAQLTWTSSAESLRLAIHKAAEDAG